MVGAGIVLALMACRGARADIGQIGGSSLAVAAPNASQAPMVAEVVLLSLGPLALALFLWRRWDRIEPLSSPRSVSPLGGGIAFFGMFLAGQLAVLVALALMPELADADEPPLWHRAALLGSYFGAQAIFAAAARPLWRGDRQQVRRPSSAGAAVLAGLGALVLFWPMVNFTVHASGAVIMLLGGPAPDPIAHEMLQDLSTREPDAWFWTLGAIVVLPGPVLEEALYRGMLQSTLKSLTGGPWPAIGITSAGFAVMHFDVAQPQAVAGLFILSLGFGWIYERTGRLIAPIVMHIGFNLANVGITVMMV